MGDGGGSQCQSYLLSLPAHVCNRHLFVPLRVTMTNDADSLFVFEHIHAVHLLLCADLKKAKSPSCNLKNVTVARLLVPDGPNFRNCSSTLFGFSDFTESTEFTQTCAAHWKYTAKDWETVQTGQTGQEPDVVFCYCSPFTTCYAFQKMHFLLTVVVKCV